MSVHSNDGTTWLTKLKRLGELSAADKQIVFNNIGHVIDAKMLTEMYYQLDGKKAVGIDKVTKADYEKRLDGNIDDLIRRIRRGTYRPKAARITEIPKEDGSTRPLAISCFEDKLVQLAVSTILSKIYEPLFLPGSYGFRPGRSCHDALKALSQATFRNWDGAVVEIDIRKYFNTIPHVQMGEFLRKKISDGRFLRLIDILMTTPIAKGKQVIPNEIGCPQGSIASPILANIYLHHVIDEWFEFLKHNHFRGKVELIRYADDMVFTFENQTEAERFYRVLPKRLNKFGLEMHLDKSQILPAGHWAAMRAKRNGKRLPTFKFLGFTCYWGKTRKGYWRMKYTSRHDRFAAKLKSMKEWLRKQLNARNTQAVIRKLIRGIKGWINYHGISDNQRRVGQFIELSRRALFRWFNRRGRKRYLSWGKFARILKAVGFPKQWKTVSMFKTR